MRYRKKYTSQQARDRIQILKASLNNYIEEIEYWNKDDKLIEALSWKTKNECKEDARKKINSILEEIRYVRKYASFIT